MTEVPVQLIVAAFQDEKTAQVPSEADQWPFGLYSAQATQQELAESQQLLDDAKGGFHRGLALGTKLPAGQLFCAMRHRLNRGGVVRWCRFLAEAFGQGKVVRLALGWD